MRRKKKKNLPNRIAMISVTFVVGVLFVGLMAESSRLKDKIAGYEAQVSEINTSIEGEEARTKEIDELKDYMQTDDYAREVARERLGLVKDNEIIFKEKK